MKIAFVSANYLHYRQELYKRLGEKVVLDLYSYSTSKDDVAIKVYKLKTIKFGGLTYIKKLSNLTKDYDRIVIEGNIKILNLWILAFTNRRQNIITWGIGKTASYKNSFFKWTVLDRIRAQLFDMFKANIVYSLYVKKELKARYEVRNVKYVGNAVYVPKSSSKDKISKDKYLIFIGAVERYKGIFELIDIYEKYKNKVNKPARLKILGSGTEINKLNNCIEEKGLSDYITLEGEVRPGEKMQKIFSNGIAVISPRQAGLSVNIALAYELPFFCLDKPITGGEIEQVTDYGAGKMCKTEGELVNELIEITENREIYEDYRLKSAISYRENNFEKYIERFVECLEI